MKFHPLIPRFLLDLPRAFIASIDTDDAPHRRVNSRFQMGWIILFLGATSLSLSARATLGEAAARSDQDITQWKATKVGVSTQTAHRKAATRSDGTEIPSSSSPVFYVVQELDVDGIQVKEFVNPAGQVFAISWSGPANPDFKTLFGANLFANFSDQQRRQGIAPGRRPAAVQSEGIRVERWGHMGNLHGRAVVPQLIPLNFPTEVLQ